MTRTEVEAALDKINADTRGSVGAFCVAWRGVCVCALAVWPTDFVQTNPRVHTSTQHSHAEVRACLSELNKELRFSHFEIRGLNDTGTETYGIVNTVRCVRLHVCGDGPGEDEDGRRALTYMYPQMQNRRATRWPSPTRPG